MLLKNIHNKYFLMSDIFFFIYFYFFSSSLKLNYKSSLGIRCMSFQKNIQTLLNSYIIIFKTFFFSSNFKTFFPIPLQIQGNVRNS